MEEPPAQTGAASVRAEARERLLHAVRRTCASAIARYADDIVQRALERLEADGVFADDALAIGADYRAKLAYAATIEAIRESREPLREDVRTSDIPDAGAGTFATITAPAAAEAVAPGTDRYRRVTAPPGLPSANGARRVKRARTADPEPPSRVVDRKLAARLRGCLAELPPDHALAVTLYLQGQTVAEAARLLGWDQRAASQTLQHGLGDLRAKLGDAASASHDDAWLRAAFASFETEIRAGARCPHPDRIWSSARGEQVVATTHDIVAHTAACAECAEAWRVAIVLARATAAPVEPPSRRAWIAAAAGGAAAIAVLVALAILVPRSNGDAAASIPVRDPDPVVRSLVDEHVPQPRDHVALRWTPSAIPDPRYVVRVATGDLGVVWVADDVRGTELAVPDRVLAKLPDGQMLWQVDVERADGVAWRSPTFVATFK